MRRSLAVITVLALAACRGATGNEPVTSHNESVTLPVEITLAPGTSTTIPLANLSLRLDKVEHDSRCPSDVQCVWAGTAHVNLQVDAIGWTVSQKVILEPFAGKDTATVFGQLLRLVRLQPHPKTTEPFTHAEYRATVKVGTEK